MLCTVNVPPFKHLHSLTRGFIAMLSVLLFPARGKGAGSPVVASYPTAETGNATRIWTATQAADGTLYFGADGLLSFDGSRWQTTPIEGAYALRGLELANDRFLWAAADRNLGWFSREDDDSWVFHSLRQNLPFPPDELGEMWHVFAEAGGALFVSENKILRWDGKKFQIWPMPGARRLRACRCDGTIYVCHASTGLYSINADGPQLVLPKAILGDTTVLWLQPQSSGWMLVTSRGLFTYANGRLEALGSTVSEFIKRESITCVAPLPDGNLAIGTLRGGIAIIRPDGSVDHLITQSDGLPTAAIYSLFADSEASLWGTSASFIFRLPIAPLTTFFDQKSGLPPQPCLHVIRHGETTLVGADTGVYEMGPDDPQFHQVTSIRERLWDMQPAADGVLIAQRRSVSLLSGNTSREIYPTQQDAYVAKRSRITPGTTLVSEGRTIVSVGAGGQSRVLVQNLPDIATTLAEDARGRIWIGTWTCGVLVAQPNSSVPVEATAPEPALGLPAVKGPAAVKATRSGAMLVFAPEGGWILGATGSHFQAVEHYPARKLAAFFYLPTDDSVWLIHAADHGQPACAARIALRGDGALWQPHSVEGLWEVGEPRCLFAEASATAGTMLWIGGAKGLLRHAVPHGPTAPTPRMPLLHAYSRSAGAASLQPITTALSYSTKAVRFEFAAPQFSLRPALRLETFIEGIDRGWLPAEPSAQREFTALRDGQYTFRVRTVAETGVASEPAVFHFEVLPPWWRSPPAIAGLLFALAPGIYGLYRLRVRSLRRHNAELEEKVGQRTAQLAKASAAKTEFIANMSHDIRNPLNGIVGLALALEDTRLDPKQHEIVATLRECTMYLSTLVDDVLDFASIEAGQIELRPGPFAPAELLRSVTTTLRGEAAEQGATLLTETDPNLPPALLGDAGRIQQILVNYAGNALKYAGGTIRLSAKLSPDSRDEIEFAVIDEGPGLTTADQSKLFTKFNRLPNARGELVKGSGLGLAACRSLADIMGGSVGVESQRGVGSTFYLRLPLAVSEPPAQPPTFTLPSATVLLVEDADYNAWAATAVLNKLGLPCERARDGGEALALFARKRFDIVLLDRNLPDMDGTEVAKRIRELEADNPRAILLAVTAYCTAEDRARCLAAGMDAFVGKPLTPEKLRKVLLAAGRRLLAAASVQISPEAPAAPLDMSLLSYISDGTDQGLGEQIERFLATLAQAEDQLEHASSARDFATLAASAHHVLSQAKMIGGTALEAAAAALEEAARAQDATAFGALFEPVRREIRTVTEALRRRRPATYVA